MADRLNHLYRWSRFTVILCAAIFALCALVALLAPPRFMGLYDTATYQARIVLLIAPFAAAVWGLSGLLIRTKNGSKSRAETRLARIMQRLSPDERAYLQQELDERLAGIGDDGELLTVNDLLDADQRQSAKGDAP